MFRLMKFCFYMFIAWALFGCVAPEEVTRSTALTPAPIATVEARDWGDAELVVTVPRALTVSESDVITPIADIVWREDPEGDRYQQVEGLLRDALRPVTADLTGATPVRIMLEVTRFHALSDRARYTIGGTHEIGFLFSVIHRDTGEVLLGPEPVMLELAALGGRQAMEAVAAGQTQRVRITDHLRDWARQAFGAPTAT